MKNVTQGDIHEPPGEIKRKCFEKLDKMYEPDWIVTSFDLEIYNAGNKSHKINLCVICLLISKLNHCVKLKTSVTIGLMQILLLNSTNIMQQLRHSYLHSELHT